LSDKASQESVRNCLAPRLEGSEAAADALQAVGVAAAAAAQAALAEAGPLAPPPSLLQGDFLAHLTAMLDRAGAKTCAEVLSRYELETRSGAPPPPLLEGDCLAHLSAPAVHAEPGRWNHF